MEYRRRPRRRRNCNETGHAHELTFSCYQKYAFLKAERTCGWLSEAIDEARKKLDVALWAYVFMPDHAHLIVWPRRPVYDVAAILHAIKEPVGRRAVAYLEGHAPRWLPKITRARGRRVERLFWQSGGGFDRNVWEPETLASMIEYVHLNPVRLGLVERASDWHWSSAGWFDGRGTNGLPPDPIPPEWCPVE